MVKIVLSIGRGSIYSCPFTITDYPQKALHLTALPEGLLGIACFLGTPLHLSQENPTYSCTDLGCPLNLDAVF